MAGDGAIMMMMMMMMMMMAMKAMLLHGDIGDGNNGSLRKQTTLCDVTTGFSMK